MLGHLVTLIFQILDKFSSRPGSNEPCIDVAEGEFESLAFHFSKHLQFLSSVPLEGFFAKRESWHKGAFFVVQRGFAVLVNSQWVPLKNPTELARVSANGDTRFTLRGPRVRAGKQDLRIF